MSVPCGIAEKPAEWLEQSYGTRSFLLDGETEGLAAAKQFKCKCFHRETGMAEGEGAVF